jgi:hypothetical protein
MTKEAGRKGIQASDKGMGDVQLPRLGSLSECGSLNSRILSHGHLGDGRDECRMHGERFRTSPHIGIRENGIMWMTAMVLEGQEIARSVI